MSYKLIKEVIKKNSGLDLVERKELISMSVDAGLRIVPKIVRYENIPGHIMKVHSENFSVWKDITVNGADYGQLTVQQMHPVYQINVDMGKLYTKQLDIYHRFGVYAAYDYTYILVLHEIRKIWVSQEQLLVGMQSGQTEWAAEMEAFQYTLDICNGRRRLIALRESMIDKGMIDTKDFYNLEKRIYRAYKGGVD